MSYQDQALAILAQLRADEAANNNPNLSAQAKATLASRLAANRSQLAQVRSAAQQAQTGQDQPGQDQQLQDQYQQYIQNQNQQSALGIIQETLARYDLPASLADWAWSEIQGGAPQSKVLLDLRTRPEYQQRFSGMEQRRQAGYAPITEEQYLAEEQGYRQAFIAHGISPAALSPQVLGRLIGQDKRADEAAADLNIYSQVAQYGGHVRNAFLSHAGIGLTDQDLLGLFKGTRADLVSHYAEKTGLGIEALFAPAPQLNQAAQQALSEEKALFNAGGQVSTAPTLSQSTF